SRCTTLRLARYCTPRLTLLISPAAPPSTPAMASPPCATSPTPTAPPTISPRRRRFSSSAPRRHAASSPACAPPTRLSRAPPRRHLARERLAHADQPRAVRQLREPDVLGVHAQPRVAEPLLRLLDGLPTLLDGRQVPAHALRAHRPEAPLPRVERDAAPNGESLEHFVLAEAGQAEDAASVHDVRVRRTTRAGNVAAGTAFATLDPPATARMLPRPRAPCFHHRLP